MDALGEGVGVGGVGFGVGVRVGLGFADGLGGLVVRAGVGFAVLGFERDVVRAWVVARVFSVRTAVGAVEGGRSGAAVLDADGLAEAEANVGDELGTAPGDSRPAVPAGRAVEVAAALAAVDERATATTPVATAAAATEAAVTASTSRTARSRRRPER